MSSQTSTRVSVRDRTHKPRPTFVSDDGSDPFLTAPGSSFTANHVSPPSFFEERAPESPRTSRHRVSSVVTLFPVARRNSIGIGLNSALDDALLEDTTLHELLRPDPALRSRLQRAFLVTCSHGSMLEEYTFTKTQFDHLFELSGIRGSGCWSELYLDMVWSMEKRGDERLGFVGFVNVLLLLGRRRRGAAEVEVVVRRPSVVPAEDATAELLQLHGLWTTYLSEYVAASVVPPHALAKKAVHPLENGWPARANIIASAAVKEALPCVKRLFALYTGGSTTMNSLLWTQFCTECGLLPLLEEDEADDVFIEAQSLGALQLEEFLDALLLAALQIYSKVCNGALQYITPQAKIVVFFTYLSGRVGCPFDAHIPEYEVLTLEENPALLPLPVRISPDSGTLEETLLISVTGVRFWCEPQRKQSENPSALKSGVRRSICMSEFAGRAMASVAEGLQEPHLLGRNSRASSSGSFIRRRGPDARRDHLYVSFTFADGRTIIKQAMASSVNTVDVHVPLIEDLSSMSLFASIHLITDAGIEEAVESVQWNPITKENVSKAERFRSNSFCTAEGVLEEGKKPPALIAPQGGGEREGGVAAASLLISGIWTESCVIEVSADAAAFSEDSQLSFVYKDRSEEVVIPQDIVSRLINVYNASASIGIHTKGFMTRSGWSTFCRHYRVCMPPSFEKGIPVPNGRSAFSVVSRQASVLNSFSRTTVGLGTTGHRSRLYTDGVEHILEDGYESSDDEEEIPERGVVTLTGFLLLLTWTLTGRRPFSAFPAALRTILDFPAKKGEVVAYLRHIEKSQSEYAGQLINDAAHITCPQRHPLNIITIYGGEEHVGGEGAATPYVCALCRRRVPPGTPAHTCLHKGCAKWCVCLACFCRSSGVSTHKIAEISSGLLVRGISQKDFGCERLFSAQGRRIVKVHHRPFATVILAPFPMKATQRQIEGLLRRYKPLRTSPAPHHSGTEYVPLFVHWEHGEEGERLACACVASFARGKAFLDVTVYATPSPALALALGTQLACVQESRPVSGKVAPVELGVAEVEEVKVAEMLEGGGGLKGVSHVPTPPRGGRGGGGGSPNLSFTKSIRHPLQHAPEHWMANPVVFHL